MTARSLLLATLLVCIPFTSTSAADKRIALVIGNSAYQNVAQLDNPKNDAALMARTLKDLGFTLIGDGAQINLDKAALDKAIQSFSQQLQGAAVALFYYAGHGVQIRGSNYLVPVNANPSREADVDFQMVDLNLVLRQMGAAGTRLNLVILDACRNNPFGGRGLRGTDSGLAQVRAPEGTLISYATQPGNVAQDGVDGDSPFTKALAATIRRPGLDIFRTFNEVGLAVEHATGGEQQPWVSTSPIDGNFYFAGAPIAEKDSVAGSGTKEASPAKPSDTMRLDLVTDCDRLAASPKDPSRPKGVDGVDEAKVDIVAALTACRDAMRQYPEVARFPYQAGRVATIQKDQGRARQLYEQAASLGSPAAMNNLAALYERGDGVSQDHAQAQKWFKMAADGGVTVAMTNLGIIYLRDGGSSADQAEARKWFERAATAGDSRAMLELGHVYETGQGVPADSAAARKWYGKAADAGMASGLTDIGRLYLNGTGVAADPAEARKWFERAAAANDPAAMNFLGTLYGRGTGVPKDDAVAYKWFEKSAALGYGLAMHNLGKHYQLGTGVPVDLYKARSWYEKCAASGTAICMTDLGIVYESGAGVAHDSALAREWYDKGASAGDDGAKSALKRLDAAPH